MRQIGLNSRTKNLIPSPSRLLPDFLEQRSPSHNHMTEKITAFLYDKQPFALWFPTIAIRIMYVVVCVAKNFSDRMCQCVCCT